MRLHISFWSQSRIKLESMVRILSVSTRWIYHPGVNNRESNLSVLYEHLKREYALGVSFWSLLRIKLQSMVRKLSVSTRCMSYSVSIANPAYLYCTNIKREYTLDVSFWSRSRIKVECFARIISGSTRCISYSYLNNRESSLSVLHE